MKREDKLLEVLSIIAMVAILGFFVRINYELKQPV